MEIFHISVISSNLWSPSHRVWVPGSPSHFLPQKLPRLATIMHESGYPYHGDMPAEWYRDNHQHISYLHQEKNILVEIHWHISRKGHPARINTTDTSIIEGCWEGAKSIEFSGRKARVLRPDDGIIHLSLHFLKHRFMSQNELFSSKGSLIQLCDIFQTFKHYREEIDWVRLKSKAEKYGIDRPVFTTLFLVKEIIGGNDDAFRNALCSFAPASLDRELIWLMHKKIFTRDGDDRTRVPSTLIQSQMAPSFQKKIKILWKGVFPGPEGIAKRHSVPLSSKKRYLYYFMSPFRLLLKYRRILWNIVRIKEETILKKWIHTKDTVKFSSK